MNIKQLHNKAICPHYATEGASAFDIFAYEKVKWKHKGRFWEAIVKTGWAFEVPPEHGLFILSRSGHGFKNNTTLSNSVGLLDYDYTNELMVKLICFDTVHPEIVAGIAVAQCVILETPKVYFKIVDEIKTKYPEHKGFGSTGV